MTMLSPAVFAFAQLAQAQASDVPDWEWDHSTPICTVRQLLSPAGDSVEMRRTPANDETELTITVQSGKVREGRHREAEIILVPGGKFVVDVHAGPDASGNAQVHAVVSDPRFLEAFRSATAVQLSHPRVAPLRLTVRSASAAAVALRACEDRKMREWGIDPAAWRGLTARPSPLKEPRDRFSGLDYPPEAARRGVEADAVVRLDVGTDGRVKECRAVNAIDVGFERASCRVLKGARFRPALDANGYPVMAPILFNVRFRLAL